MWAGIVGTSRGRYSAASDGERPPGAAPDSVSIRFNASRFGMATVEYAPPFETLFFRLQRYFYPFYNTD